MTGITFDTHEAVKGLIKAGFDKKQAEALVDFEKNKDTSRLATKQDMSDLKIWSLKLALAQVALIAGLFKILG